MKLFAGPENIYEFITHLMYVKLLEAKSQVSFLLLLFPPGKFIFCGFTVAPAPPFENLRPCGGRFRSRRPVWRGHFLVDMWPQSTP